MLSVPRLIMEDKQNKKSPIVKIVTTLPSHIAALKVNLRCEDVNEILHLGVSVQHALWYSYRRSLIRKTALIDSMVAAAWGVHGTFMGKTGVPWLLTSPKVKQISPLKFAKIYQEEVLQMLKIFQRLENYVHAEYDSAVRLLEIIGFTVEEPQAMRDGMYRRFWIEA